MPKEKHGATYYTVSELAELLDVHRNSVIYWINSDKLKAVRFGLAEKSPFYIPESEVKRIKGEMGGS